MLKIWGRKSSSNVQALMWCIAELELEHERIDAGFTYGLVETSEFLAINPNGTVPVLQDGKSKPIWETGAILRYIATTYGDDDFWPKEPRAQAQIDKWAEWSKINITINFTEPIFWRLVRTAPSQQDPQAVKAALEKLNISLAIADAQLAQNSFIAGDKFSLADIQFGHCLYRYYNIDMQRQDFVYVEQYYQRLTERAAFKTNVMVSYDELRVFD